MADKQEYPKTLYKKVNGEAKGVTVSDPDAEAKLGNGWFEDPDYTMPSIGNAKKNGKKSKGDTDEIPEGQ